MCDTHEPPLATRQNRTVELESVVKIESAPSGAAIGAGEVNTGADVATTEAPQVDIADIKFSGDITRGEMCAFMIGYAKYLPEANVGVSSVLHFMPGMKVGIATNPRDFDVFNR